MPLDKVQEPEFTMEELLQRSELEKEVENEWKRLLHLISIEKETKEHLCSLVNTATDLCRARKWHRDLDFSDSEKIMEIFNDAFSIP